MSAAPATHLRELYRELILDHARHPRHFGCPDRYTHDAEGINPLCGDKLHLYLTVEGEQIREVSFEGTGCAISVASASLLADAVGGHPSRSALELADQVASMLHGNAPAAELGKLRALAGVCDYPSRVKCASLAWRALRAALDGAAGRVSTE